MKNNKITEEEQDIAIELDKLGKLCSERKTYRQKMVAIACLSGRRMCITWYLYSRNWDRVIPR